MKYIVIDIESTGVDSQNNQILEIGAIMEDSNTNLPIEKLPKFKCIVRHDVYLGSSYAINMNSRIFQILSKYDSIRDSSEKNKFATAHNILKPFQITNKFIEWIQHHDKSMLQTPLNIAGKNFPSFDKLFLDKIYGWQEKVICERRYIDPSMLYVNWKEDKRLPSLDDCLQRAGINTSVTHDALQDAIDTLLCLRASYNK